MPRTEMGTVEVGGRSTLYATRDGACYRQYHDTGAWAGPLPMHVDERGVFRGSRNRRIDALVARAFAHETFRGSDGGGGAPAPYLRRALQHLVREPRTVRDFARLCGVEVSTAWCYACKCVETWPSAHPLPHASSTRPSSTPRARTDRTGPLRDLMERVAEHDWRTLDDRYAHLRPLRLCAETEKNFTDAREKPA